MCFLEATWPFAVHESHLACSDDGPNMCLQTIPRTVLFDQKTESNLLQWPVDDVETLRSGSQEFSNISIPAGSVVPLDVGTATQVA